MAERPASPPRRLRACAPCSKVKARCHFNEENAPRHLCERCDRLGIECSEKRTKALRKARQTKAANSEGSVGYQVTSQPGNNDISHMVAGDRPSHRSDPQSSAATLAGMKRHGETEHTQNRRNEPHRQSNLVESRPPLGLSWDQVSRILVIFRSKYLPVFPFLNVEESASPQQLHTERPFLLRSAMLVAAPLSVPRIAKMKRNVLAYMSQQVFIEERKTFDLLQGLLICIAWGYTCQISDEQVINLSHLALGYAHNLGLTRIPRQTNSNDNAIGSGKGGSACMIETSHSPDEQRALLGLYCIHSVISAHTSRSNPIDRPYPEMCRAAFSDSSTSPPDLLLDRLVRLVQMSEVLSQGFGEPHERDQSRSYVFLLEGRGRRFRTELNRLIEFTSHPDLAEHQTLFQLYLQYLIVRLYEPAVTVANRPEDGVPPSRYRCLCLHNCVDAVQSFLELLTSTPMDVSFSRSIITADQASFVLLMGARLLLIESPDWDAALARQRLDLRFYLDKVIARVNESEAQRAQAVEAFSTETGIIITDEERQVESKLIETARKTRWLSEWFEARLQGLQTGMEGSSEEVANGGPSNRARAGGDVPFWYNGLLENVAWNFDP